MERMHPRDMQSTGAHEMVKAAREAAAMNPTASTPASGGLLGRGARIARSLLTTRKCVTNESINTCEKPVATTGTILGVLVGCGYVQIHPRLKTAEAAGLSSAHIACTNPP